MIASLRVAELLCARLCHELVNPIGACNNGLEMLGGASPDLMEEAAQLAIDSADSAARILQFFRLAYGTAVERAGPGGTDLKSHVENYFKGHRISLNWSDETYNDPMSSNSTKLLLNLLVVAEESLPRGGSLTVEVLAAESRHQVAILAIGEGARVRPEAREGLNRDLPDSELTTRNIQSVFCRLLAAECGADVSVDDQEEGCVVFSLDVGKDVFSQP
ncbi:histidine phosphotransferase family protein [Limibacillus halophilus]|uniref:Histidine phosphotransferase ChpT n=1 Tax=Limibacillus halophilus TaxID=1579333 RepID=A0A839SPD3_9PROT|nr:histidine phosphotransferase family protein [Limibacillus halophilus]MBB3064671.1 histidine phosphotransferase ChpT [Limibacillus halophilus]